MGRRRTSYFDRYTATPGRLDELVSMQRGLISNRIHLIASASYPFDSVLRTLAEPSLVLATEGLPGDRYLPGSQVMDAVEDEGERLILRMFGSPTGFRATLQPHSGTQANQIVYNAVLSPDDKVLSLRASDGGHISHTVLISRRQPTVHYGLTNDGAIDYEQLRRLAIEHRPRLIIVGGSALPRSIDFQQCAELAGDVGALLHADVSHTATFIAAGLHPNALPHCDFVTFNTMKNLRGPNGGLLIYRSDHERAIRSAVFPTTQGGVNESILLAKLACLLEWRDRDLRAYAKGIVSRSQVLGATLAEHGLNLVTGGTDCHLLLLDLRGNPRSGAELEAGLERLGVLANRNQVPGDPRSPRHTSGLRLGTTNLAILDYNDDDLGELGRWIAEFVETGTAPPETIERLLKEYQSHLVAPMW